LGQALFVNTGGMKQLIGNYGIEHAHAAFVKYAHDGFVFLQSDGEFFSQLAGSGVEVFIGGRADVAGVVFDFSCGEPGA